MNSTWCSSCQVKPTSKDFLPLVLPLGPLEFLSAGRWLPISLVFDTILNACQLKSALETSLQAYPIFAGRLVWNTGIHCQVARLAVCVDPTACGGEFTEGVSDLTLNDLMAPPSTIFWPAREALARTFLPPPHPRDSRKMITASTPLVHIALVYLAQQSGSVLTIEFAHCIGDGASFYHFLECWAKATQANWSNVNVNPQQAVGPFDVVRRAIQGYSPSDSTQWLFVSSTPRVPESIPSGDRVVSSTVFWLDEQRISAMKASVLSHIDDDDYVSTNDILTVLIWQVSSALSSRIGRPSHLRVLLNFRTCFQLPRDAIGNMIYSVVVKDEARSRASEASLATLAKRCRQAINEAKTTNVASDIAAIYHKAKTWRGVYWNEPQDADDHISTYTTNLSQYKFSSLCFGDACPVDQLEAPYGAFPFMFQLFSVVRGGVRVVAHLPPSEIDEFQARWETATVGFN
ncbi:hypothetical protein AeNC1_003176 [Aphanomyces euteiches]|nr:hypothetical protein AeNC1_003176 [Aphanomyces euteiches]